jgi:hypothetical protein
MWLKLACVRRSAIRRARSARQFADVSGAAPQWAAFPKRLMLRTNGSLIMSKIMGSLPIRWSEMSVVEELTSDERETLYNGLMQRELHDARAKAIQVADLLASYLQFLGKASPSLANDALEVRAIMKRLRETP